AAPAADEFHADFLSERTQANHDYPVSEFARHVRRRRQMDTIWTLAALYQGLTGTNVPLPADAPLTLRVGVPSTPPDALITRRAGVASTPTRSVSEDRLAELE